jgi:hypothetical protein
MDNRGGAQESRNGSPKSILTFFANWRDSAINVALHPLGLTHKSMHDCSTEELEAERKNQERGTTQLLEAVLVLEHMREADRYFVFQPQGERFETRAWALAKHSKTSARISASCTLRKPASEVDIRRVLGRPNSTTPRR